MSNTSSLRGAVSSVVILSSFHLAKHHIVSHPITVHISRLRPNVNGSQDDIRREQSLHKPLIAYLAEHAVNKPLWGSAQKLSRQITLRRRKYAASTQSIKPRFVGAHHHRPQYSSKTLVGFGVYDGRIAIPPIHVYAITRAVKWSAIS